MKRDILYFMMAENIEKGGNWLSRFIPVVEDCIATYFLKQFSCDELKCKLEEIYHFGKSLLFYNEILKQMCDLEILYCNEYEGVLYYEVKKGVKNYNISDKKRNFENHLKIVTTEYLCYKEYDSSDEKLFLSTEEMLLSFMNNFFSEITELNNNINIFDEVEINDEDTMDIAIFLIRTYQKQDETIINCISTLLRALLCLYYIYSSDELITTDLSNLKVFLDSPLLINMLGYNGKFFYEPISNIVKNLKSLGAEIYCYSHTINEIENILHSCEQKILSRETGHGFSKFTVEYFLKNHENPSVNIKLSQMNLKKNLESIDINIFDEDIYDNEIYPDKYRLDIKLLEDKINAHIGNENISDRAYNDALSIYSTYLQRKGIKSTNLDGVKALFITHNSKLANISTTFIKEGDSKYITTTLLYSKLAVLLEALCSTQDCSFALSLLVMNSYAAVSPSDEVWSKHIKSANEKYRIGAITGEEYTEIRQMDLLTYGVANKHFTYDAISEVPITKFHEIIEEKNRKEKEDAIREALSRKESEHKLELSKEKTQHNQKLDNILLEKQEVNKHNDTLTEENRILHKTINMNAEKFSIRWCRRIAALIIGGGLFVQFVDKQNEISIFFSIIWTILSAMSIYSSFSMKTKLSKFFKKYYYSKNFPGIDYQDTELYDA